ncbi:MAG: transglutaminase family protein [Acidobacteriaceae bacterium]|nr:transglutaminase family protein [Acidobacteriaceae bacterium]
MRYRVIHRTTYKYSYPVSLGNHLACLTPRFLPHNRCTASDLRIKPAPATRSERTDYFGNVLTFFTIHEPHRELVVEARSEVIVDPAAKPWPHQSIPWEDVPCIVSDDRSPAALEAYQFVFQSPRIRASAELAVYASQSFTRCRPFAESLLDLTARIHHDFRFDSKATNVRTTTEEVFRNKRGVCQDFAHLQIACLRSLHLPARYASGYLRSYPRPDRPALLGANVSHAWVSAYCPGAGWLDVDPTNNVAPSLNHVTLAWGRDYGDVSPLRGFILGGRQHTLKVSVRMEPIDNEPA